MNLKNKIYQNSLVAAIIWTLIIFILCAMPGQYIPTSNWLELLSFDKFVHASIFFILTTLWFLVAIKHQQSKVIIGIYFTAVVTYGALLELMQATIFSNRSADWKDIVANSFGCLLAIVFYRRTQNFFLELKN
ncbi:VanZ family protein [Aurantibacillus circumpalustris]|uniref:VanZ family protein n=1 Tax=Aurantibacillus circumpalustris TaxID=3036359 RepID=UPI00295BE70D|nr:VanZ family protein [Aurantibacillus circumpalustris]